MKKSAKVQIITQTTDENENEYRFQIEIFVYKDSSYYVSYCPALDLTSTGETFNEAVSNFYEAFQLYVECCIDSNTLYDDLIAHGWKFYKQEWKSPTFNSLLKKPEMKNLINSNINYERIVAPARIPAFV